MKFIGANIVEKIQATNWSPPSDLYQSLLLQMNNPMITQSMIVSIISNVVIVLVLSIDVESN